MGSLPAGQFSAAAGPSGGLRSRCSRGSSMLGGTCISQRGSDGGRDANCPRVHWPNSCGHADAGAGRGTESGADQVYRRQPGDRDTAGGHRPWPYSAHLATAPRGATAAQVTISPVGGSRITSASIGRLAAGLSFLPPDELNITTSPPADESEIRLLVVARRTPGACAPPQCRPTLPWTRSQDSHRPHRARQSVPLRAPCGRSGA